MIHLDFRSTLSIYEQIIEQMKMNIIKGYLNPGDNIPSIRKLSLDLGITHGTVAKAYQELERQNPIETIKGKGTYISSNRNLNLTSDALKKLEVSDRWRTLLNSSHIQKSRMPSSA